MSIPWSNGLFHKIIGLFKGPRDPLIKNIHEAIVVLDKMINFISGTRRNLEDMYDEHKRRAKIFASEGRKDYEEIFLEELKHISSLISLFDKVHYDLMRVRYRLETITVVEEPMRLLPEIVQELEMLRPEIERIAPELASMLVEVERKVNSVMSSSDVSTIANMFSQREWQESVSGKNNVELPPPPPEEKPRIPEPVSTNYNRVSLATIRKWILDEIRNSGGVFIISEFSKKYRVPRHMVRLALKKLEQEGLIKTNI